MAARITLHRATVGAEEELALIRALRQHHLAGNGPECRTLEAHAGALLRAGHVLAVNSCSAALEMALRALGLGQDDEVLVPSFTFVTSASAVLLAGATPVFCDIDPETLNVTAETLAARASSATRAVLLVHYGGAACDMDSILALARERRWYVIEDAAHALGATWDGRSLGTLGDAGAFSLHASKSITCGEGGLLVVREAAVAERARVLREKGTDRQAFVEGRVDRYTWLELGASDTLSDLLAALATAQLARLEAVLSARREVAGWYAERLVHPAVVHPRVLPKAASSWLHYAVQVPASHRPALIQHLARHGIEASSHYVPLHRTPYARTRLPERSRGQLPATDAVCARLLRLPLHPHLSREEVDEVCTRLEEALELASATASGVACRAFDAADLTAGDAPLDPGPDGAWI